MASTSKESLERDDSPSSEFVDGRYGSGHRHDGKRQDEDVGQLNLFDSLPAAGAGAAWRSPARDRGDAKTSFLDLPLVEVLPAEPFSAEKRRPGAALPDAADPAGVVTIGDAGANRDFADVRKSASQRSDAQKSDAQKSDADDLRRIEDSIRWLVSAGAAPMPRPASLLSSVRALVPLEGHDDDSLLLDPETLFAPRQQRRRRDVTAGLARLLLVGAVAAPTAYFIADWMQFSRTAGTSGSATVSSAVTTLALSDRQNDAAATALSVPTPQPVNDVAPTPPPQTTREGEAEAMKAPPADPPPATHVADLTADVAANPPVATVPPTAPEPPPAVTPPPVQMAPPPPPPAVAPVTSTVRPEEIARMLERGRILFEAGDIPSARLVFRRAADAGDAAAAIAMGATYDPEILAQRFIRGIEANPAEAQRWYERARQMGQHRSTEVAEGH